MIQEHDPVIFADLTDLADVLHDFRETVRTRAVFFRQIRHSDIFNTDLLVLTDSAFHVLDQFQIRNMCGDRGNTDFVQDLAYFFCSMTVQTSQLNAVITHILQLLDRTFQVILRFVTHGIYLNTDRDLVHRNLLGFFLLYHKT